MSRARRTLWSTLLFAAVGLAFAGVSPQRAEAQLGAFLSDSRFELADTVQLDRAESAIVTQLERVKAQLADRQWDEAVEALRQIMESSEGKLMGVTEQRFVNLSDYCQMWLAALPPEALKLYRGRVDPLARKWYQEGVAQHDRRLLSQVVQRAFASSWGDKALFALGEMSLEKGDYAGARWHWERILPCKPPVGVANTWPGYPDTSLDLATVRARLVLASILEGSTARAREELSQFIRLHPDARGRLAGREIDYAQGLREILGQSLIWQKPRPDRNWPTFAGSPARNKAMSEMVEVAGVVWRQPLPKVPVPSALPAAVVAENAAAPLSYHPVLMGDRVLVNTSREILAFHAATGEPVWGKIRAIYREKLDGAAESASNPSDALGLPRFTMTVHGSRLYARMGSSVTCRPQQSTAAVTSGELVCLDLEAEGRLVWKVAPEEGWAFEGAPLADADNVYVAMRRSDIRPQAHVACLDARTGRIRWRRFICGAETPARGMLHQNTHNLLTLAGDTLYYNTNLGAVAALTTDQGRLLWVSLYPRARRVDLLKFAPHWQRDLNPCLADRGTLLVAPADSPRIFAFDAGTGQMLWHTGQTGTEVDDVVHLLGVAGDQLIASGRKLYWIGLKDANRGRVTHVWPDGQEKPGYGRGLLAGDSVLWPVRDKIFVFDQATAQPKKTIELAPIGAGGGNLLVADGRLLVATGTELIALGRQGRGAKDGDREVAAREPAPLSPGAPVAVASFGTAIVVNQN
jgi:cellulose synthase operon protein C